MGESFAAVITFKWFVSSVDPYMLLKFRISLDSVIKILGKREPIISVGL